MLAASIKNEPVTPILDEECIPINSFQTSDALKNEIGMRILTRREMDWHFVSLCSKGPYIYLTFKQLKN